MIALALGLMLSLFPSSSQSEEKPSPVKILSCEFPLGDRFRPGRWFPLEITVQADAAWEGILWVQLAENGPISEKALKLAKDERIRIRLPVLPGTSVQGVAVDTGASLAKFAGPVPSQAMRVLLVGDSQECDLLREQLAATPRLVAYRESIANAIALPLAQLPAELYSLDSFDLIALSDGAARAANQENKDLLLRWAVIRGRLFARAQGKVGLGLDSLRAPLVEVAGNAAEPARRFPLQHLAPDRLVPLQTRHFARAGDLPFWVLAVFGAGFLILILRRREEQPWSAPALLAGGCATLLAIPTLSWSARTPVWRCLMMEEDRPALLLEDRATGKSLPLSLDPRSQLLLPKPDHKFIAEWTHDASKAHFFLLDHERRLFQAQFLEGRQFHRGPEASLRNGFAPLESVAYLLPQQEHAQLLDAWDSGESLAPGRSLSGEKELLSWPRPLRDFFTAPWVSGAWLTARIVSQDPSPPESPFGGRPAASYLLWFPRVRE